MPIKQRDMGWIGRVAWACLPVATMIGFVVVEVLRVTPTITISNLDYFPLLSRAVVLSFRSLNGWVHPIHPVGFPWLIRLGLTLGWDAERVGQGLSILGGVLGLAGTYLIALSVFHDKRLAAIAQALVAMTNVFLYFGSIEGNDMLAAGLQVFSLGVLATLTLKPNRWRIVVVAGLLAGLAYLVRYTGLITAMASVLWLAAVALYERRTAVLKVAVVYAAAFLAASALQTIPSWMATGNPFSIDQGQNVWFHLYGKTDFISEFEQVPQGVTVARLVLGDPALFIQHWWESFQRFWVATDLTLLDVPLKLFAQAGFVFLLLASGPAAPRLRWLLALFVVAHLASLSMMRLDRRFLIIMIPLLAIGAVYFFAALIPPRWKRRRSLLSFNIVTLLVGLVWASQVPIGFVQGRPAPDAMVIQVSNALHAAGMTSASEVINTRHGLQDVAALARDPFQPAFWAVPGLASVDELTQAMRANEWRFFIYDRETGTQVYPALESLLTPETRLAELAPIYFPENREFVIYRLVDKGLEGCKRLDAHFEDGISLDCYEAHISQAVPAGAGRRIGVYLSWRTESHLDSSLKVFVHLLDSTGRLVAQHDGAPVLWTYPTDQWKPGEAIVDFHQITVDASVPPGEYTLEAGLYDDASGVRLKQVDKDGNPIADAVALSKISIGSPFSQP